MTAGPFAPGTKTVAQVLAHTRELVEPAHRAAVDRLPESLRHIAGYHAGWWNADGTACAETGKAVRPALVLAAARAVGGSLGDLLVEAAVPAAVAVELVHDFSLLHDDVMDHDLTRRHRPSAWSVFGVGQAILAGDALQALSIDVLAELATPGPALRVLTATVLELCAGQSADISFEGRTDVTLDECLTMAAGKTAALLGCACELGAIAVGAAPRQIGEMRSFGRHLGTAFQLVDDLLGIWGDPKATGKPVGSDLRSHKKSLPVMAALSSGTAAGAQLGRLYYRDEPVDDPAVVRFTELIERAGARRWASVEAEREIAAALACLQRAGADSEGAQDLRLLADLITHRNH
ncbi:MAG: Geranylgeranyl pyrophosphate synthase-like protein [Nocardia sp.]|uniref:polyprenyl synthetase family protein n=1 Tax=Nocardia sp. TaxID=1821 RepID=UPI00262A5C1A|nr:polyprenyl synthetase family protein [Nocardia sp.]MCU1639828.1 Geranylgeranyl pyrophosphate synthase-like protein [Nocardia sp.]